MSVQKAMRPVVVAAASLFVIAQIGTGFLTDAARPADTVRSAVEGARGKLLAQPTGSAPESIARHGAKVLAHNVIVFEEVPMRLEISATSGRCQRMAKRSLARQLAATENLRVERGSVDAYGRLMARIYNDAGADVAHLVSGAIAHHDCT